MKRPKEIGGENNDVQMKIRPVIFDTSPGEQDQYTYLVKRRNRFAHSSDLFGFVKIYLKLLKERTLEVSMLRTNESESFFFPKIVNACRVYVWYVRVYIRTHVHVQPYVPARVYVCTCM